MSRVLLIAILCPGWHAGRANADVPQADRVFLSGRLIHYEELKQQRLPLRGGMSAALAALDYEDGELPLVYIQDLNADGASDYLLGSPHGRLCGTAGCPYMLADGESFEIIGEFFRTIAVLAGRVATYPVIQTLSKRDITTTNLDTFVFDGRMYRLVSHALVESRGLEEWHGNLRADP